MTLARDLARFVVSYPVEAIPDEALERAEMVIASTLASVAMGVSIESTKIIRSLAKEDSGKPEATVWFDTEKLPISAAAKCNAVSSDAAASDDSDMRSIAHIGTIVSTTAVATAERVGSTGLEVLQAMVLGYEVAGRIDESLTPGRMQRGFHGSVSTVFGGTVAVGKLLGLNETQMAHALGIAATSIGGMAIAADTSWAREYHAAMSAMLGVMAAQAAQRGFEVELAVLEAKRGFLSAMGGVSIEEINASFGTSWDICTDMAIKLMPGAHPFHAIAQAAEMAAVDADVNPQDIEQVIISAAQMKDWMAPNHPRDLIGAAHSVVYFVAAAIVDRGFTWVHMTPEKMVDPVIAELQNKVVFDQNPTPLPDRFTHRHGGTVIIKLRDGRTISRTCKEAKGHSLRGVKWSEVDDKYLTLTAQAGVDASRAKKILEVVHNFRRIPTVTPLTELLLVKG
jgi:2-methylcitrate dehydratase PrpD